MASQAPVRNRLRDQRRRSRNVLLWIVAGWWFYQLGAGLLLDRFGLGIRFPYAQQVFDRSQHWLDHGHRPQIIALGSSRMASAMYDHHVTDRLRKTTGDPNALFLNANVPAGDFISSEFVLNGLLEQGHRPRFLVLETMPENVNHLNDWLKIHVQRQLDWSDVPEYFVESVKTGNAVRYARERCLPLYLYRYHLVKAGAQHLGIQLGNAPPAPDLPGASWGEHSVADSEMTPELTKLSIDGTRGLRRDLRDYRVGGVNVRALERILALCDRHEITPIFVTLPLPTVVRAVYDSKIEHPFQNYVHEICQKHRGHYVDLRTRVPDWLFIDHHHQGSGGTKWTGEVFVDEVLAPLMAKGRFAVTR